VAFDGADAQPRAYHNLTLLPDGSVLASGGTTASDGTDLSKACCRRRSGSGHRDVEGRRVAPDRT